MQSITMGSIDDYVSLFNRYISSNYIYLHRISNYLQLFDIVMVKKTFNQIRVRACFVFSMELSNFLFVLIEILKESRSINSSVSSLSSSRIKQNSVKTNFY